MLPLQEWRVSRWAREHRFGVDAGLAACVATVGMLAHFLQSEYYDHRFREPSWWTVVLVVVTALPIAWRRRNTIAATLVAVGLMVLLSVADINGAWALIALLMAYALGTHAAGVARTRALMVFAAVVVADLIYSWTLHPADMPVSDALWMLLFLAVCFLVGDRVRRRRNEVAELSARAHQLENERDLLATQRVVEERTRIARDLHDVVAHSVSVMVVQAAAARRNLQRDPGISQDLLENVEATGRQTMNELRQILGVLRESPDQPAPTTPVLDDIEVLARSIPELDTRITRSGTFDDVPAGVAVSAYRVVQEALTNVQRHAGPNVQVEVELDCTPERVNVSVADNGRGASTRVGANGGYGLVGMGERVAAFGGKLRTGPRRSGGWEVRAHFPLNDAGPR